MLQRRPAPPGRRGFPPPGGPPRAAAAGRGSPGARGRPGRGPGAGPPAAASSSRDGVVEDLERQLDEVHRVLERESARNLELQEAAAGAAAELQDFRRQYEDLEKVNALLETSQAQAVENMKKALAARREVELELLALREEAEEDEAAGEAGAPGRERALEQRVRELEAREARTQEAFKLAGVELAEQEKYIAGLEERLRAAAGPNGGGEKAGAA